MRESADVQVEYHDTLELRCPVPCRGCKHRADEAERHEPTQVIRAGFHLKTDRAGKYRTGRQLQAGRKKFHAGQVRLMIFAFQDAGFMIPIQREADLAILVDKDDLGNIQLIKQYTVGPFGICRTFPGKPVITGCIIRGQSDARFGQFCEQAHHLLPPRNMLVQVAKVCTQLLQVSFVIKRFQLVENKRYIDHKGYQ